MKKPLKTSSKTAVKKTSQASKSKAKVVTPAKKASKPAPAKAAPTKAAAKVVTKVVAKGKPVVKPAPKVLAKVAPKVAPKTVQKPAPKAAVKPVSKTPAKAVPPSAAKPVSKVAKPPVKVVAKGNTVAKAAPKVAPKADLKPAPKTTTKTAPKDAPKATPKASTQPASKEALKAAPKLAEKVAPKATKEAKSSSMPDPTVAETPVVAADVPARAVRPSARLAQITVPSMAQSVASTAAKASYLQNMPTQVITPPPFVAVKKDPKLANNWKTKKPEQLTDAEVMAMSDNDYMNEKQMAFFRLKLVALKQGILANAGETTEHLREDTVVVPDPADRATIEEEHALELRTRDRERKLLKKIEQSIQRIDAGDYGYCDETGEPIGVGRLLARPTANLSLEAQQRRELKQKMFGD